MSTEIEYGFWFWSNKLGGVLTMLSELVKYSLNKEEIDVIREKLNYTNDEENSWSAYQFIGQQGSMNLRMAYDAAQGTDMTHIRIITSGDLKPKLEALDLFQCLFKQLDMEDH